MRRPKKFTERYKVLLNRKSFLLGMSTLEIVILLLLIIGASSAFLLTHKKLQVKVASNTRQSSGNSTLCRGSSNGCNSQQTNTLSSPNTSITSKPTSPQSSSQIG